MNAGYSFDLILLTVDATDIIPEHITLTYSLDNDNLFRGYGVHGSPIGALPGKD